MFTSSMTICCVPVMRQAWRVCRAQPGPALTWLLWLLEISILTQEGTGSTAWRKTGSKREGGVGWGMGDPSLILDVSREKQSAACSVSLSSPTSKTVAKGCLPSIPFAVGSKDTVETSSLEKGWLHPLLRDPNQHLLTFPRMLPALVTFQRHSLTGLEDMKLTP